MNFSLHFVWTKENYLLYSYSYINEYSICEESYFFFGGGDVSKIVCQKVVHIRCFFEKKIFWNYFLCKSLTFRDSFYLAIIRNFCFFPKKTNQIIATEKVFFSIILMVHRPSLSRFKIKHFYVNYESLYTFISPDFVMFYIAFLKKPFNLFSHG